MEYNHGVSCAPGSDWSPTRITLGSKAEMFERLYEETRQKIEDLTETLHLYGEKYFSEVRRADHTDYHWIANIAVELCHSSGADENKRQFLEKELITKLFSEWFVTDYSPKIERLVRKGWDTRGVEVVFRISREGGCPVEYAIGMPVLSKAQYDPKIGLGEQLQKITASRKQSATEDGYVTYWVSVSPSTYDWKFAAECIERDFMELITPKAV